MSLVCREWRRPAQRALGKILVLQGDYSRLKVWDMSLNPPPRSKEGTHSKSSQWAIVWSLDPRNHHAAARSAYGRSQTYRLQHGSTRNVSSRLKSITASSQCTELLSWYRLVRVANETRAKGDS